MLFLLVAVVHSTLTLSVSSKDEKKKMVCYYGSWAVYRPGAGKFDVENIDPYVCTHIIFGFAGLGYDNTIVSLDPYNDLYENYGKGAMERFTGLKQRNPQLVAILAIGGWNEGSLKYSQMASDPAKRAKFTQSVVDFLLKLGFDGLDLDWEYPANRGGVPEDTENFVRLIGELKAAFTPHGLLLTAAVSCGKGTIDSAYNVPEVSRILDQIHLMCYDFHGAWEDFTGHNSPLYGNAQIDDGESFYFNTDFAVNYWIDLGADPSKLILGMPLYGRGFLLANAGNNGFYETANQPLPAGPYTREAGIWGNNEICEKFTANSGWTVVRDPYYMVPYAYNGNQWIGFDDRESLTLKAQYAASKGLGGAMVWSIETDDFSGSCTGTPFFWIRTIYETLNGPIVIPTPPTTPSPAPTQPGDTTTTRLTTPRTTRPTTPTPAPGEICSAPGFVRDPNDCTIFYQCIDNGQGGWTVYTFNCGAGTVFDPSSGNCNFPELVPGC
jgi:chitinase